MIETMIAPETVTSLHSGSVGFNALICPTCGDRCGYLFIGLLCLECELNRQDSFVGAEDVATYSCSQCANEFPVVLAQDADGVWLIATSDQCPACGHSGSAFDLAAGDPDVFWDADQRAAA